MIHTIEGSGLQYTQGKSLDYLWGQACDFAWGKLCDANPILKGIELGISGLDVCFDSTNRASSDLKLALLYITDCYMQQGMSGAYMKFSEDKTVENAQTFLACFRAYMQFQMYGNEYINGWLEDYLDGGVISNLINMIFYQENIQTAKELIALAQSQVENRRSLLMSIDRYANIYQNRYGITELEEMLQHVSVKGVAFSTVSFTVNKDVPIPIYAQTIPENATNQNITYASSDANILEVPVDGGFATVRGTGTVTVTAITEDGGYAAYQTITIQDREPLSVIGQGKYGENVRWRQTSDGTLYIYGKGDMKDYSLGYGFFEDIGIKNVIIAEGVTSIKADAFLGCRNLASVNIPEGVTSIGDSAFFGCRNLASVNIPEGVTSIKADAFLGCSSLASISIPGSVTSIGGGAFSGCSSLASINIPESVTSIGGATFSGCSSLASISIPGSVTSIGAWAFESCSSLVSVSIPESVTSIGYRAFEGCSSLASVSIPESVTSIEGATFSGCSSLASISIPGSVTSIGAWAFESCSSLVSVSIPESVTSIRERAFGYYDRYIIIDGFTIIGKKGSAAEKYAIENGISFIDAENLTSPDQSDTEDNPPQPETENTPPVSVINVASISLNESTTLIPKSGEVKFLATVQPTDAPNQTLAWSSSDEKIATVDNSGVVTGKSYGTATITATATDGSGVKAQCKVTVGYSITYKLNGGSNNGNNPVAYYKQSVSLKNPSKKGYLFKGWYTDKKCKKKLTKISAKSNKNITVYAKWEKIKLGKASITSLKNSSSKKAVLKFKKVNNADGYKIVYGTDRKLKKNCVSVSTKKITITLKKLKKGKTYYVKVQAYRKDSAGKKVYGKYSAVKKIEIKK